MPPSAGRRSAGAPPPRLAVAASPRSLRGECGIGQLRPQLCACDHDEAPERTRGIARRSPDVNQRSGVSVRAGVVDASGHVLGQEGDLPADEVLEVLEIRHFM